MTGHPAPSDPGTPRHRVGRDVSDREPCTSCYVAWATRGRRKCPRCSKAEANRPRRRWLCPRCRTLRDATNDAVVLAMDADGAPTPVSCRWCRSGVTPDEQRIAALTRRVRERLVR